MKNLTSLLDSIKLELQFIERLQNEAQQMLQTSIRLCEPTHVGSGIIQDAALIINEKWVQVSAKVKVLNASLKGAKMASDMYFSPSKLELTDGPDIHYRTDAHVKDYERDNMPVGQYGVTMVISSPKKVA